MENSYIAPREGQEGYYAFIGEKMTDQGQDFNYYIMEDVLGQKCVILEQDFLKQNEG